jgi:hypothetical protein
MVFLSGQGLFSCTTHYSRFPAQHGASCPTRQGKTDELVGAVQHGGVKWINQSCAHLHGLLLLRQLLQS